ncbi:MAG: putative metallopeptidase [Nanoarchaeota archaeon]
MKYEFAPDIQEVAVEVSKLLYPHVKIDRIKCFRSYGTSSRGTIARCHALSKIMQISLGVDAFYPMEFIHERFDKLPKEEQTKVIIHELMHIPKAFGGGFRHHDWVCEKNVNKHFKLYMNSKEEKAKEKLTFYEKEKDTHSWWK